MDCPSFDELSAWHDGETDPAAIDAHIASCTACQGILEDLEQMDDAMLGEPPPAEVLARIHEGCLREVRKPAPKPTVLPMSVVLRLAAIFALVGIALFMQGQLKELDGADPLASNIGQPVGEAVVGIGPPPSLPPAPPPVPISAESADLPPPVPEAPMPATIADVAAPAPRSVPRSKPVSVDYGAISLVAAGAMAARARSGRRATITAPAQNVVAEDVHHVWLADDVVATLEALRDLMPKDHHEQFDSLLQEGADSYSLTLSATDRNLQALVNHMASIGMVLVSPEAPQPQAQETLDFSDRPVRYHVDFVKK